MATKGHVIRWTPIPAEVATDVDLLLAPPEVQALVFRLVHNARAGRVPVRASPEAAVTALCGGAGWATKALACAVDLGFVEVTDEGFVLAWEWPTMRGEAPSALASEGATPDANPDTRVALARLKALFSKFKRKTCAERVAWLDSEHGQRALNRLGLTRENALPLAEAAGRKGGRFGHDRSALTRGGNPTPEVTSDGGNHGGNVTSAAVVTTEVTLVSPAPPSGEKKNNKNDDVAHARAEVTTGGNRSLAPEVTDPLPRAPDHPLVAALVAVGGIVEPDYETARHLEAALVKTGVTADLATAWGADLATPTGRKVSWPWLRTPDRPVTASFLRQAKFSEGHGAWSRVGDGFTMWRHWYSSREKARAKLPSSPPLPAPPTEAEAREQARRFKEDLARRRAADQKDAAHG
jgi:hypothetical protein